MGFHHAPRKSSPSRGRSVHYVVMAAQVRSVVSAQWLSDAIKNNLIGPKLRILDASWHFSISKRVARDEFVQKHIPGSSFFDIDECRDQTSSLEYMLPTPGHFSRYVGDLGIGNDTHVVVYDTSDFGCLTAPRVWWMFRLFGHRLVSVLDGGMKNWVAEGLPLISEYKKPEPRDFRADMNRAWVKNYEDILENIKTKKVQVVDTRPAGRFRGIDPEFKTDVPPGHFPGAINVPFTSLLDASGKMLGAESLSKNFAEAGVDLQQPLWVSCAYGVTACHVALAAHLLGHPEACIYDGSWTEWVKRASPEHIVRKDESGSANM